MNYKGKIMGFSEDHLVRVGDQVIIGDVDLFPSGIWVAKITDLPDGAESVIVPKHTVYPCRAVIVEGNYKGTEPRMLRRNDGYPVYAGERQFELYEVGVSFLVGSIKDRCRLIVENRKIVAEYTRIVLNAFGVTSETIPPVDISAYENAAAAACTTVPEYRAEIVRLEKLIAEISIVHTVEKRAIELINASLGELIIALLKRSS